MQPKHYGGIVVCALVALGFSRAASAAVITGSMQDPFDYPAATQFGTTPNGGQGWNTSGTTDPNAAGANWGAVNTAGSASAKTATSPGLTYSATGYLAASGNKLTLDAATGNQVQNVGRIFGGQTIDAGSTYFSVLMSRNTANTQRTFNLAFFNGTTERFAVGQIGAAAGGTSGNIALLMNNTNPAGLVNSASPIAMGDSVTHLIVGRIDWVTGGNETVSIWVDPTDVTTEAAAGTIYASTSGFELTALTGVRPFAGNTIASPSLPAVSANYDELRLGGTWASVTSQAVAVGVGTTPEPGTMALGLGVIALTSMPRRRRNRG